MAMTKCKECQAEISTTADACPRCGAKQVRTSGCAKVFLGFIVLCIVLSMIGRCGRDTTTSTSTSTSSTASAPSSSATPNIPTTVAPEDMPPPPPQPAPGSQWYYGQSADPMGKGTTYGAVVMSTNKVEFDFPYNEPQQGKLSLRAHPRMGKDVIFAIERGQLLCRSYDGCTVLVRFDDGAAQKYSAMGPSDNSSDTLFIENYDRFVTNMKKAKTVRIAAEVFQEGAPVFEFDVSGFDQAQYQPKKK